MSEEKQTHASSPPPPLRRSDDPFTVVGPSGRLRTIAAIVEMLAVLALVALAILLGIQK